MKTKTVKALLILGGLMLLNTQSMHAGIADQFKNFVGNEFTNFHLQSLYLIGGIILTGLSFYVIFNHADKEEKPMRTKVSYASQQRRQHHRAVIKKTA